MENKAALAGATKALVTQRNQLAGTQTSIDVLDRQLDLVQQYSDKINRPDSPLVNKYLLNLKQGVFGDKDTAALNNIIKTASSEFARILSGASSSIASTPVSTIGDAEKLLNSAMSQGQLTEILKLMRQESDFRLTSQIGTINDLQNTIHDIGTSATKSTSTTTPSTTGSSFTSSSGKTYTLPNNLQ